MPKISIIVPVYNVEKELSACLESVLSQSLDDIEIIGVDDGGTDRSAYILKEYASRDDRVKVISYGENKGLSYARNRGLEKAIGKYIIFVDSDDMITSDSLSELYRKIEETQSDGVIFDLESLYDDDININTIPEYGPHKFDYPDVYTGQQLFSLMKQNNDLQLMAFLCIWKKDFLKKHKISFHEGILHEDNPFSICAMLHAQRMSYLKKTCYVYRRRSGSISVKAYGYRNLYGLLMGNADVIRAMINYKKKIDYKFGVSVTEFIVMVRKLVRLRLVDLIKSGKDIAPFYSDNYCALLEWHTAVNSDYVYIKGLIDVNVYRKILSFKKIIVYGFGKIGREVVRLLEEFGISNYRIAVTKNNNKCYGLSGCITEIADLEDDSMNTLVLISVGEDLQDKLEENARKMGFKNIVRAKDMFK